jgi:NifB/MoaA-like Fe-S oxidoreductase
VRGSEGDDYPQIEDGVGMVRQFFDAHAKRMKQLGKMRERGEFTPAQAKKIYGTLATGVIFYPMLKQAVNEINSTFGTRLQVAEVRNTFFGEGVTVAGLLSGVDFLAARDQFKGEFLMLPPHCYREHDQKFLDGTAVNELTAELLLPIKHNWNEVLGLHEQQQAHRTLLSHDYGAVTSISV